MKIVKSKLFFARSAMLMDLGTHGDALQHCIAMVSTSLGVL